MSTNKTQLQTNNTTLDGYIARINAAKEVAASLPDAGSGGGSSGGIEYEVVTIPIRATSAKYALSRVTAAYGGLTSTLRFDNIDLEVNGGALISIEGTAIYYLNELQTSSTGVATSTAATTCLTYSEGTVSGWSNYCAVLGRQFSLILINDPNSDAIST